MTGYYSHKLSGERLRRCYEIASTEVQRYLRDEIDHLLSRTDPSDRLIELGCGYGRVLDPLRSRGYTPWGIDTSVESLRLARWRIPDRAVRLAAMDAVRTAFPDGTFDSVLCVQNGISAFGVDPSLLLREAIRIARPGGRLLFSTYAASFWQHRLAWFQAQATEGLIGEIDERSTGNGVIRCKDGFRATLFSPAEFRSLVKSFGLHAELAEVGGSSLFCEMTTPG